MAPSEVVLALARTLKEAANEQAPQDEYRRGQLLSASSMARHLAAEESFEPELRRWFHERALALLIPACERAGSLGEHALERRLRSTCGVLERAGDGRQSGDAVAELLADLHTGDPAWDEVRRAMHALLRELCDQEVTALAKAPV